jgi:hypothetical protein
MNQFLAMFDEILDFGHATFTVKRGWCRPIRTATAPTAAGMYRMATHRKETTELLRHRQPMGSVASSM